MHSTGEARVLDLYTSIHDDRKAAVLRDTSALFVDYRELAPEAPGTDRNSLRRDRGQRRRCTEYIDDVHGNGDITQAGIASLSEDLGLARIHRNNAVAMSLQVETNEVAGA